MNPLPLLESFDPELHGYFAKELKDQRQLLSFVPDDNSTSPLCAAVMGNVLINFNSKNSLRRRAGLESLTAERLCKMFNAGHANLRTLTIETASRAVFQALTHRGDVVMSLDLRKKEHCNTENLVYRFVNFGVEPRTQRLNLDLIEKQAQECKPKLIIFSPINYPLEVDFKRLSEIARSVNALLWCDISQTAGLVAGGVLPSPLPYADVVTLTSHGAMQGPQVAVILSSAELGSTIDRTVSTLGHRGILTAPMAAFSAHIQSMTLPSYKSYSENVLLNARALCRGLEEGGMKIICGKTDTHLVMVDSKSCALSARGVQESLRDAEIKVRVCDVLTADKTVRFDAVRFSSLPVTTRGVSADDLYKIGKEIALFLQDPDDANLQKLRDQVLQMTSGLPDFAPCWMDPKLLSLLGNEYFFKA